MMSIEVVAAFSSISRGIGSVGALPWRIAADLRRFKRLTIGAGRNAVIMGRRTWESIPERYRPLPDRINVVLTQSSTRFGDDVITASSLDEALALLQVQDPPIDRVFVIGGESVYADALKRPYCHVLHVTRVQERPGHAKYDAFFPEIDSAVFLEADAGEEQTDGDETFAFSTFVRRLAPSPLPHEEHHYLSLIRRILGEGVKRDDRTGTGTLALFGAQMRFDLSGDRFPLLTTKRVFWRGVVEELLWFLRGCTDGNELSAKGIRIWDGNGSREFLDSRGLHHRRPGDLGPVYGFQWRHFGAQYTDCSADYARRGVDQLAEVVRQIRTEPENRRIVMSAWNPADLSKMALPPCHMFVQFFVENGRLSSLMYQRSCDMGLGVPFNIASYALLTRILAHVTDLEPGQFIHVLGDAHIYLNHVDALRKQIERNPRPFPKLTISAPSDTAPDAFRFEDFVLEGYNPHPPIKMDMAV